MFIWFRWFKSGFTIERNSIIVSATIAFLVGHTNHLIPSVILLSFHFVTILLGILKESSAGKSFYARQELRSYQTFFLSVDLVGKHLQSKLGNYSLN
jgi:hypothetical protein